MSDTTLGINIKANDAAATAAIRTLETTVKSLSATLAELGRLGANASGVTAAAIQRETAAIKEKIAALTQEIAVQEQLTAKGRNAAQQEAEYLNRDIDLIYAKQRAEAEQLNASFAAREASIRQSIALNNARVFAERKAEEEAAAAQVAAQRAAYADIAAMRASEVAEAEAAFRAEAEAAVASAKAQKEAYAGLAAERASEVAEAEAAFAAEDALNRRSGRGGGGNSNQARHAISIFDSSMRGQRGQAISSIGAAAKDAGFGIAGLTASMGGLVALMGSAAILRGAEAMGKWATESRAAASATGMSIEDFTALQGALSLVGVKADSADTTLRRLSVNLGTALSDPASKVAEAFHNLGISQQDLDKNGTNTAGALRLLADAFARTEDGANKSAAMNEIFGRGFENIIPALQKGGSALDELKQKAKDLGLTLTEDTATKLETTGRSVNELSETIKGDGIRAFTSWSSAITEVTSGLGKLFDTLLKVTGAVGFAVSAINSFNIPPDIKNLVLFGPTLGPAVSAVGKMFDSGSSSTLPSSPGLQTVQGSLTGQVTGPGISAPTSTGPKVPVPPLTTPISQDAQRNLQMATAENAASQGQSTSQGARIAELQAGIAVLKQWVAADKEGTKQAIDDQTQLESKLKELHNAQISQGATAAKQSYADFAAGEKLKVTEAQGSSTKIQAIYNEWLTAAEGRYRQSAAVIAGIEKEKVQAINTARLSEMKEDFKNQDQQTSLGLLNAQLTSLKGGTADTATKQQGPSADLARQKQYQAEAAQVEATAQQRIAAYQQEANVALQGSDTQKNAQQEIMSLLVTSKQQEVELYKKAAEAATQAAQKMAESFVKFFDQVGSQFESFSSSIINAFLAPSVDLIKQGMTTIKVSNQGNEIRSAFRSVFLGVADDAGKALESALSKTIANALSSGASNSIGELLGNWLSKAFSSVVSSTASSAAGSAIGGGASQAVGSTAVVAAVGTAATGISTAVATAATTISAAITTSTTAIVSAITTAATTEDTLLAGIAVKPEAAGFTFALGGIVPSAAGGMTVGGTGASLAILHAREMVLPAHISEGIQSMISGGRGSGNNSSNATLNYSPTINPSSRSRGGTGMTRSEFSQMLAGHSGAMLGEARNMIRNGWRTA